MKVKNISGKKIEVAGYRLCSNHILDLKNNEDVSAFIKAGLLEVVE